MTDILEEVDARDGWAAVRKRRRVVGDRAGMVVRGQRPTVHKQPLAALVQERLRVLFDELGTHRAPDLYRRVMGEVERVLIVEALKRADGSRKKAAEILGIHRNTLRLRMRVLAIEPPVD